MGKYYLDDNWLNKIRLLLKWRQNIRITGPGVNFKNSDQGMTVCVNPPRPPTPIVHSPPPVILAKITGNLSANDYTAKSIRGEVADTATYADSDFGDELAEEDDIIARDRAQIGGSTPRPLTGLIIAGKVIGRTDDGKRIVEFASAVQKLRIHGDQLQATYLPNPAGDSDWVDMVEGYDCDD